MDVREKLVELLDNIYLPMTCGPDTIGEYRIPHKFKKEIAEHLIAHGVTVQEWISVTDRLPEVSTSHKTRWDKSTDSIRVLCACVQADGKKMVKEGYCKVYSDGFVHWKIPGTIHSVTHWQYLPQPPKGE